MTSEWSVSCLDATKANTADDRCCKSEQAESRGAFRLIYSHISITCNGDWGRSIVCTNTIYCCLFLCRQNVQNRITLEMEINWNFLSLRYNKMLCVRVTVFNCSKNYVHDRELAKFSTVRCAWCHKINYAFYAIMLTVVYLLTYTSGKECLNALNWLFRYKKIIIVSFSYLYSTCEGRK